MPSTYNGIGTHYYGKKNQEHRQGECPHCGRITDLTSYDTRLWFVVLFIPVIPLGRKRIIDYCASCTRHYAAELGQWEAAKQLEISGAMEKHRTAATPESAIAAHQQLVNFHEMEQADEFRKKMKVDFADNAKVHLYLGMSAAHLGQYAEAKPLLERAHELRPDMPEAKVALAHQYIRDSRLVGARKLLEFLEQPGASQLYSLEPLHHLAFAFQAGEMHADALELYAKLIEAYPHLADHKGFRKAVKESEKALKRKESILPRQKFSFKRLINFEGGTGMSWAGMTKLGIGVAVVLVVLVSINEYVRRHRKLYFVNGYDIPATVEVEGVGRMTVGHSAVELPLSEGRYHARITGPVQQTVDFEVRASYLDRWFDEPAWLLNVGGAALVIHRQAVYSSNPGPGALFFHFGKSFEAFPKITHPFVSLPNSLSMKRSETRVLEQLELANGEVDKVFYYLMSKGQKGPALALAEWRLRLRPGDLKMLRTYVHGADSKADLAHVDEFLRGGLTNQPVVIEWHRLYQSLNTSRRRDQELVTLYDGMLAKEPGNSGLLYLRARVDPVPADATVLFGRARQADPKNPYPYFALGWDHVIHGDWAGARPLLARAAELNPEDQSFVHFFRVDRLALREHEALDAELKAEIKQRPLALGPITLLCDSYLAQSREKDAMALIGESTETLKAGRAGASADDAAKYLLHHLLYATGKFALLAQDVAKGKTPTDRQRLFEALLEDGRLDEAGKVLTADDASDNHSMNALACSLAWRLSGNNSTAMKWQQKVVQDLKAGDQNDLRLAELLLGNTPPTREQLDALSFLPANKALALASLAHLFPADAARLVADARQLNVQRDFPYHLISRAVAGIR